MYISAPTLDDVLFDVFESLTSVPFNLTTTRSAHNGNTSEVIGAMLCLTNPRARLSRTETKGTIFSALGELLWYLSKSNNLDFIKHYIKHYEKESDDGCTIYGAYGPRLFASDGKYDQVANVIKLLQERPSSRRAAIQLFEAKDLSKTLKEIPCTCTLQFLLRDNLLHMIAYMRSNDAFFGLPHDVFAFSMLQEIIARTLGVEVGTYNHSVGSLHLYENMLQKAKEYLNEGVQPTKKNMPEMPKGDPWPSIHVVLDAESKIRKNMEVDIEALQIDPYWKDLVILLKIHALFKERGYDRIKKIKESLSTNVYNTFIEKRLVNSQQKS